MSICFMTRWRPDRGSGVLDEAEEESSEKSDHDLEREQSSEKKDVWREEEKKKIHKSKIKFVRHITRHLLVLGCICIFFLRSKRYIVHN